VNTRLRKTEIYVKEAKMFAVKEYNKSDGSYIGATYLTHGQAIKFAEGISKRMDWIKVVVTEIDYNVDGEIWEMIVWGKE
jgi:hypothetical protein